MANIAPIVNQTGPLFVHDRGVVRSTHFHAMAMYAYLLKEHVVTTDIGSDSLTHNSESVATVDAIATCNEKGDCHSSA